jgi:copper chaperone
MKTFKFKTNIKCGGCISNVTPFLNDSKEIKHWNVDISDPNKILTVETETLQEEEVKNIIIKAGYKAELLVNNNA